MIIIGSSKDWSGIKHITKLFLSKYSFVTEKKIRALLVVQWFRIPLPAQGT